MSKKSDKILLLSKTIFLLYSSNLLSLEALTAEIHLHFGKKEDTCLIFMLFSSTRLFLNLKNELTSTGIYSIKCVFAFLLKQFAFSQDLKGTCSGIALVSAQVHLLAWWISGLRTQLLCGNQGDNCCQATTGLDQCAYTVKKQHSVHASVLVLHSEKGIPITSSEKISHKHLLHTARTLRTYSRALQQHL